MGSLYSRLRRRDGHIKTDLVVSLRVASRLISLLFLFSLLFAFVGLGSIAVHSLVTGVQPKTNVQVKTTADTLTFAADYDFGSIEVTGTQMIVESNPPTFVLNWPYAYSATTTKITVTASEGASRSITFDYSVLPNGLKLYGVSSGRFTNVQYTASNSTLWSRVVGTAAVGSLQYYMTSCDGFYTVMFDNGTVVGALPYYNSVTKIATIPYMGSGVASLFTPIISSVSRTVPSTWNMGEPGAFAISFQNNAPYALSGLKMRFQLLDGSTVKQNLDTSAWTGSVGSNSKSFSITPTGITETKSSYTLRLILVKNSPEWIIATWDQTVTVQALGSSAWVSPSPRLVLPIISPIWLSQGESKNFTCSVGLSQVSSATFIASTVAGVPSGWVTVTAPSLISTASPAQLLVSITVPADAPLGNYSVQVPLSASTSSGSTRQSVGFTLIVKQGSSTVRPPSSTPGVSPLAMLNDFLSMLKSISFPVILVAVIVVAVVCVVAVAVTMKPKRRYY